MDAQPGRGSLTGRPMGSGELGMLAPAPRYWEEFSANECGTKSMVRTLLSMSGGSESTDEALWLLAMNGDGDAFGKLYDRHRDQVLTV